MQTSVSFGSVLETLGAIDTAPVETSKNWDFYDVKYHTPAGNLSARYLYLNYDCPQSEATLSNLAKWKSLAASAAYTVVATTRSRLAKDLSKTAQQFGGMSATTPRALLFENVVRNLVPPAERLEEFKYFVEPDIAVSGGVLRPAVSYLVDSLVPDQSASSTAPCAVILVAPAGLGKTTLCRTIARKLIGSQAIPILVESAQWQNLINLTLPNILNAALLQLVPEAGRLTSAKIFQILIREQLLVPIFDGFDELCLHPNSDYSPTGLITELLDLVGDAGARILITVRETFWEKYREGVPVDRIERADLQGFSNDQRHRFFTKRLASAVDRDIANRIAREVGGKLYESEIQTEPLQKDRASGIPLLLELVALYVDGNPDATFAPASHDPLGHLLQAVCERENVRQQLNISSSKQMKFFEELFRDYAGDIKRNDIKLYLEYIEPSVTSDTIERFESHAFFSLGEDLRPKSEILLRPRFETLRVYFIARWLANSLAEAVSAGLDEQTKSILERNATGSTDVFDYLVRRFLEMSKAKAIAAISHALKMIRSQQGWHGACSALFHLTERLAHQEEQTRRGRVAHILQYFGSSNAVPRMFSRVAVHGQISGLDLSGVIFVDCVFKDLEFKNCAFDEKTEFRRAQFEGSLNFENCERPGRAQLAENEYSDEASRAWDIQSGRASGILLGETSARVALREVLRRFVGQFGFSSIKEIDRKSGAIARNPYADSAWEELIKGGVIDRHAISGVTGGGLHIVEAQEVRHEVRSFLDNAALGPRLKQVLQRMIKQR